jgi:H+-transporting ATPase
MSTALKQPAAASVPAGLSSAEAARRLAEFSPNSVVEERIHPLTQIARHFWAPVPWMLEATIALQIAIGERLEALMIAALLLLNVALGVFQENRAGAALALLKRRLALKARVKRDAA